ncbi:molecular chaperone [Mycobacterium sp. ACS1612]|uniref:Hsp70 family protein n=1 Tax=Mycobacterium sp. ACS1612 TaxID=1834117 RepID=UPI0007FC2A5D|nr:Hsp70 family protein [Mycobacterium sp. ACS1612]OBF26475.1 molecular chaperone [Mycobacterium sp. ACS1612]
MSDGVGLSVGATNLAAVVVGRTAVRRSPVVTLYPHRPAEVGVPSENPNLAERGLIITDFVDRVGDPVGIVAADGSTHMADRVLADALRAMRRTVGHPGGPVAVTYPAHWRPAAVDALSTALASGSELAQAALVSDAYAALTALQDDPGLPTRGVVALCDFGGTGTSITLADAANGFAPIGPTVRHTDFSGDLIDQALLTHVLDDLSAAGTIVLSGTSAIGSLSRLRAQCRGAKERLSTAAVTSLVVELPGHHSDVRLTRNELDEAVRGSLAEFVAILRDAVERNGIRGAELVAVATAGGGARMPIITTTLSEHLRVPVVTTAQPELTAAIGGGLKASRGTVEEGATSMAVAPGVAAAAAAATAMAPEVGAQDAPQSSTFGALAWSDADDAPDVAPSDSYDYDLPAGAGYADGPRPQMQFDHEAWEQQPEPLSWYRKPALVLVAGVLALLAALTAAVLFVMRDESTPAPASTTGPTTTTTPAPATTAAPPPPAAPAPEPQIQAPRTRTVLEQAPPPPVTVTEAPPPTTEAPPPTTQQPPWSPPYSTVPGLPWVPAPPTIPGLPPPANP